MKYKDVDIYECKFIQLNKENKLSFIGGVHKGKTPDDFSTITDLHHVTSYCFWMLKDKGVPLISKYTASAFLGELTPKLIELEKRLRKRVAKQQKELEEETKKSAKTPGKTHI